MHRFNMFVGASVTAVVAATAAATVVTYRTGPSSSATPYVIAADGSPVREVVSILTVGDSIGGFQLTGIPDGIGSFMEGDNVRIAINHEHTSAMNSGQHPFQSGSVSGGSSISKWLVNPATFEVLSGGEAMTSVQTVTNGTGGALNKFTRFCSGDIADTLAYYNTATGRGTDRRIFMCGEESGTPGRMMATDLSTGIGYELTKFNAAQGAWENGVARPMESDATVMMATSDGGSNRVFLYRGTKQSTGTPVEKAGLTNGTVNGIQVVLNGSNVATESRAYCFASAAPAVFTARFTLAADNTAAGTTFLRPEDGAWDPMHPSDFYFATTDQMSKTSAGVAQAHASRLFRLRFDDVNNLAAGGTIEAMLDGTTAVEMLDNLCVYNTIQGGTRLLLQEDPGGHPQNAKTWMFDVATRTLTMVLKSDPARFGDYGVAATAPFSTDEENSGVVDARGTLGLGWFLADMQAHYTVASPLVEGGQLYAFFSPQLVGSCDHDLSAVLDAQINGEDIAMLCLGWGSAGRTDLNGDGNTDPADLAELLISWGECAQ